MKIKLKKNAFQAIKWTGKNAVDVHRWVMKWGLGDPGWRNEDGLLTITEPGEKDCVVSVGQWIIRDNITERFYRMEDAVFHKWFTK